jgi:hypothetical protein
MSTRLLLSSSDSSILLLEFMMLFVHQLDMPINTTIVLNVCSSLKYLLRGTAAVEIKRIERDPLLAIEEKDALQKAVLLLIPKVATPDDTVPLGRLNAFSGLVQRISPSTVRPTVEDMTITTQTHGAATIGQQIICTADLRACIGRLLHQATSLLESLLLGFSTSPLLDNVVELMIRDSSKVKQMVLGYSTSDWIRRLIGMEKCCLSAKTCDFKQFKRFLHPELVVRKGLILSYTRQCDLLIEMLFTLIQLTSGPPARVTESASLLYRNTKTENASVIVSNGVLCLLYAYNKVNSNIKSTRQVVRPVCLEVASILLPYLALVRPFQESLLDAKKTRSPYLLVSHADATPLSPEKLRLSFTKWGCCLGVKDFRHYIKFLLRKYLERETTLFDINLGFGHSEETATLYGATADDVKLGASVEDWNSMVSTATAFARTVLFLKSSSINFVVESSTPLNASSSLLTFQKSMKMGQLKNDDAAGMEPDDATTLAKVLEMVTTLTLQTPLPCATPPILSPNASQMLSIADAKKRQLIQKTLFDGLQRYFGRDRQYHFKSSESFNATAAVYEKKENVVIIAPTGFGKTLSVALPIFLEETTCSIYVVPLNSLQADLDARFRARGISSVIYDSVEWRAMSMSERCKQIILVNYFHAVKGDFAKAIKSLPLVTRIIFDEANTIQDFNSFMQYNSRLVELAATFSHAQLVFMSATLSARKLHQLLESFQLLESQPLIFEVLS